MSPYTSVILQSRVNRMHRSISAFSLRYLVISLQKFDFGRGSKITQVLMKMCFVLLDSAPPVGVPCDPQDLCKACYMSFGHLNSLLDSTHTLWDHIEGHLRTTENVCEMLRLWSFEVGRSTQKLLKNSNMKAFSCINKIQWIFTSFTCGAVACCDIWNGCGGGTYGRLACCRKR